VDAGSAAKATEVLAGLRPRRILDVGCGEGALRAALPAQLRGRIVGLDASASMLSAHPPPVLQADATACRSRPASSAPPWPCMPLDVGCVLVFGFARFVPLRGSVGVEHDS
jgi:SAM-dependent methyltransferase